eukprot:TRINITY_DN1194_c0_g1_i2.p1 TRINITY_DN1194_c0_g1~~TRINITY_DN1194_c0_g1_i2.p1  ORF type:complete len:519 (-),score=83.97 TRINITY_DN1194_c0_g1_i2:114-1670(-)
MARVFWASHIVGLAGALFVVPQPTKPLSCSPLQNHGAFSTVQVKVGVPPTTLDLVADTGSNDIIVQSCLCKMSGDCPAAFGKCYSSKGDSASVDTTTSVMLAFGSGEILAAIGSDYVQVGLETVYANKSLLLMVKQKLDMTSDFEGILGLGRPEVAPTQNDDPHRVSIPGFLEIAKDPRFSMCFNRQSDGVLSLNTPKQDRAMGSVGQMHWGLDFRGISVGDAAQPVMFCSPADKKPGMETACGIIPDSGTTLILGSAKHVNLLFNDLCQRWDLCRATHAALLEELEAPGNKSVALAEGKNNGTVETSLLRRTKDDLRDSLISFRAAMQSNASTSGKSHELERHQLEMSFTFQKILQGCTRWLPEDGDIDKVLPSLFFHVAGADGATTDTLEMKPSSWVIETPAYVAHITTAKILGAPLKVVAITEENVCQAAFQASEYPTTLNGQVWIMGTPLFYEYKVHYDREPKPPTMSFAREACGSCVNSRPVASASLTQQFTGGRLRFIDKISTPRFNTSMPF